MVATDTALSRPPQIEGANFLNLMIIDDDRAVREACRAVAQSLGFSPQVAESAEQAYLLLDSRGADVILLDLKLPGARGLDALHTIRKHRPEALIYWIWLSPVQRQRSRQEPSHYSPVATRIPSRNAPPSMSPLLNNGS